MVPAAAAAAAGVVAWVVAGDDVAAADVVAGELSAAARAPEPKHAGVDEQQRPEAAAAVWELSGQVAECDLRDRGFSFRSRRAF